MPEQGERMEQALRGCAEAGVPETVDLWPEIRERVTAAPQHSTRRFQLSPRTRIGWVFAVLAVFLIVSTAAFATAGALGVLDDLFGGYVPGVQEEDLSTPIDQTQTKDGITVTIDRVYADSEYVVVGYTVEGLNESEGSEPFMYNPLLFLSDSDKDRAILSQEGTIEASGLKRASPALPEGSQALVNVFETTKPLEAGEDHRFRATVLIEGPGGTVRKDSLADIPQITKPFVFDFTVPIKDVPTVEVNQTVEAGGVPITLTEVVLSPARTSAYLCFEPPDKIYDLPVVKTSETRIFRGPEPSAAPVYHNRNSFHGNVRKGCATYVFDKPLYNEPGEYSLTITELRGSRGLANTFIEGPWKFTFEVPEQ